MVAPPESRTFIESDHLLDVLPTECKAFSAVLVAIPACRDDARRDNGEEAVLVRELCYAFSSSTLRGRMVVLNPMMRLLLVCRSSVSPLMVASSFCHPSWTFLIRE